VTVVLNIRPENRGSFPSGDEDFSVHYRVQTGCVLTGKEHVCVRDSFKRMRGVLKVEQPVINRLNIRKLTVSSVIEQFGLFSK
jgi:hypothetical protein